MIRNEEKQMMKLSRVSMFVLLLSPLALTLATGTYAQDQYPILDKVAAKVVQKYTSTPCEELWQKKQSPQPPSPQEQKAIQFLKTDPQMRVVFINKVAAPIANKMFDCGLIP
jgi:hypothetical protein